MHAERLERLGTQLLPINIPACVTVLYVASYLRTATDRYKSGSITNFTIISVHCLAVSVPTDCKVNGLRSLLVFARAALLHRTRLLRVWTGSWKGQRVGE